MVKKVTSPNEVKNLLRKLFFLSEFEMGITEYSFAPQNEPHTAKLNISGVWKHFHGN